jgi:hypothetical protein
LDCKEERFVCQLKSTNLKPKTHKKEREKDGKAEREIKRKIEEKV